MLNIVSDIKVTIGSWFLSFLINLYPLIHTFNPFIFIVIANMFELISDILFYVVYVLAFLFLFVFLFLFCLGGPLPEATILSLKIRLFFLGV